MAADPGRWACVNVPSLALQVLARQHPEWRARPLALVAEDRPQAVILQVNERARQARILPGLRYAAALALSRELCAGVVPPAEEARVVAGLVERLRRFTPDVEPAGAGVFWLAAGGLERLHPSLERWAEGIRAALHEAGFVSSVALGFTRFGTYALARARRGVTVCTTVAQERRAADEVPLVRLELEPGLRDELLRLGIVRVGEWRRLPAGGLELRFGAEARRRRTEAAGEAWQPLQRAPDPEPCEAGCELEHPESDSGRLLFLVKRLLDPLLRRLVGRGEALQLLELELRLDDGGRRAAELRPAAPTLDGTQLLELVRLRLEGLRRETGLAMGDGQGVVGLHLRARGVGAPREQLELFARQAPRARAAAERALARLRAEFGAQVVVRARLREAHLPGARFEWRPLEGLRGLEPAPRDVPQRPLVRRLCVPPLPLPHRPRREPDGWLLRGLEHGRVRRFFGPYLLNGGWWHGAGVQREYSFAEMDSGEVLWIYYDARRRRWFLEGRLE